MSQKVGPLEIAAAIGVVVFGIYSMSSGSGSSSKTDSQDQASMASIKCETFVKDRLKAPATADFPFLADHVYKVGENGYRVESHVDAQNAFGAKIRGTYTCEVQWNGKEAGDAKNWTLVNLDIQQ